MKRIADENSALVYLHTYETPEGNPTNEERLFARVPTVGEQVALSVGSDYYRVYLVIHTPFEESDYDAEVYAVKESEPLDVLSEYRRMFG